MSVCMHIWSSLHACTCREGCKHTCPEHESRPLSVSPLKTASPSIQVYTYVSESLHQVQVWPPWVHADPGSEQWACVCARPQLSDRSHWPSRWRPCDPQSRTRDRHDTGRWPKGALSGETARQLVCVSMFMEYAFMPARKSWARSPPPTPRVSGYGRGQRSCGFFQPLFQN